MKVFMKNKENIRNFFIVSATVIYNCIVYQFGVMFPERATLIGTSWDLKIPFINYFIYFYVSWYALIFFVPFFISLYDKNKFKHYIEMISIALTISLIIFLIFPTVMERTNLHLLTNSFTDRIIKFIYKAGSANACLPSLHVLLACGYMMPLFSKGSNKNWVRVLGLVTGSLIIASTLLVKQHVIYDVITSIAIDVICWYIVNRFNLDKYFRFLIK